MTGAVTFRGHAPFVAVAVGRAGLLSGWVGLLLFAAVSAALLGPWALMLPIYAFGLFAAVTNPRATAAGLLVIGIVLEPSSIDFTRPISAAFWQMPPGFENAFKFTTSPIEVVLYVATASALVKIPSRSRLPAIAWGFPLVIALGFAYGWFKGGQLNLGYNEARGLLAGIAVFLLAVRVLPTNLQRLVKPIVFGESLLAISIITRYLVYVRGDRLTVPVEFAFSHEGSVILGVGFVIGVLALIREDATLAQRLGAAAYSLLLLAAMIASGRRAATLILLVGGLSMGALLFPRRPMLVILTALPIALAGSAYLVIYWNHEYGAIAQPARVIRSQFDRTLRDGAQMSADDSAALRRNVMQVLGQSVVQGEFNAEDRTYLANTLASRMGIAPEQAAERVDQLWANAQAAEAQLRAAADKARQMTVIAAFINAVSMLIAAVAAYAGAVIGGNHRDTQSEITGWYRRW